MQDVWLILTNDLKNNFWVWGLEQWETRQWQIQKTKYWWGQGFCIFINLYLAAVYKVPAYSRFSQTYVFQSQQRDKAKSERGRRKPTCRTETKFLWKGALQTLNCLLPKMTVTLASFTKRGHRGGRAVSTQHELDSLHAEDCQLGVARDGSWRKNGVLPPHLMRTCWGNREHISLEEKTRHQHITIFLYINNRHMGGQSRVRDWGSK